MKIPKLKARFVKVNKSDGSQDLDKSYWVVLTNEDKEKTVSQKTVEEFIGSDPDLDYDIVATAEFGAILIKKVRNRLNKLKAFW